MSQSRTDRMYQRIFEVVQEEIQGYINDQLMGLMKSLGIDPLQLRGMATGQAAFDPYKVLNLQEAASDEEVRRRYLELIAKLHPDRAGAGFEFLAALVNAAYQAICHERGIK